MGDASGRGGAGGKKTREEIILGLARLTSVPLRRRDRPCGVDNPLHVLPVPPAVRDQDLLPCPDALRSDESDSPADETDRELGVPLSFPSDRVRVGPDPPE
jgi:hypothetical protein